MAARLGVGFVGAGGIVRSQHAPRLRAIPGVELVAVATRTLDSATAAARELDIPRVHARWQDLVVDSDIDLVVVGTWPDQHAPVSIAALEAGKHVLCEARMAWDLDAASRMLEAARSHPSQVFQVAPASFSLWVDGTIGRLLRERAVGDLRTVRLAWSGGVYGADPWRRLRRHSGVNTMALGIVLESMARWFGQPLAVSAAANIAEPSMPGPDGSPVAVDIPDHLVAILELPDGVMATVDMSATPRPEPNSVHVQGNRASLEVDLARQRCWLHRDGRRAPVRVERADRGRWCVERDCVDSIRAGRPVRLTDAATAWRYMATTQAIVDAAAQGRRVTVPLLPE